ncbi:MAG: hypothetical protein Q9165_003613 [Trypethelium subeluteriae]
MIPSEGQTPATDTAPGASKKAEPEADYFDWGLDREEEKRREEKERALQRIIQPCRSAFLILLLEWGFPKEHRGILYFLMIQFHEDLEPALGVYSTLPAILMWYFPRISPLSVYTITRIVDQWRRSEHRNLKDSVMPQLLYSGFFFLFAHSIDVRAVSALLEYVFGPARKWPAAVLPIFPGIFLRLVNERPNSINGFVPEDKHGIMMAIFVRACTAVLPRIIQWMIWVAYAAPSVEYPAMFVEWVVCTYSWTYSETSPLGAYAIWLLVNQYRHTYTWFRMSGGGPSVILQRERRGTLWYIATIVFMRLVEKGIGFAIVQSEILILHPQVWISLALVFVIGLYLLKFGLLLRVYKYKYRPLQKGETIRLVRLRAQPCLPNSPIQCDMIHTTLRRPPQYIAVSHCWDPVGAPQELVLIDGGLFPVSRAIHSFLLAKRSNMHHQYFWIDSICINQDDKVEKSRQVGMMRNIFEEAELTLGWLGDEPGAKKAFGLIRRINGTTSTDSLSMLRSEPESGWSEFEKLMSNEWFERVWIIQEIAVAKAPVLRYGNQEMDWDQFAEALTRVMLFGFQTRSDQNTLLHRSGLLSALIMEEVKSHIANVDFVKLKDTLKLALRFKATLPIDKVYALLGLIDERHTPLFHPRFGVSDGTRSDKVFDSRMVWKDVVDSIERANNMLELLSGTSPSRRARAMLSSGAENAMQHMVLLNRDLRKLNEKLKRMKEGIPVFEEDPVKPDYSEKITARLVYTYVARDFIKNHDAASFIHYAGIGLPRNQELTGLPSWVPDWSTDVQVYLFPWRKSDGPKSPDGTETNTETPQEQNPVFQDGGSKHLFVKGSIVGTITHSAILMQDYDAGQFATREDIERDFVRLSSNFQAALEVAKGHLKPYYKTDGALEEAFYRTLTAGSTTDSDLNASSLRPWAPALSKNSPISAALWPEKVEDYWEKSLHYEGSEAFLRKKDGIFQEYLFIRRMKSSANAKFAHLIRADIVPSFSQYRRKRKDPERIGRIFMLNSESAGPLSGYAQYVDYTIGRSLIVVKSGLMGLAPADAKEGDIVIQVQTEGRIIWLTLREDEYAAPCDTEDIAPSGKAKVSPETDDRQPSHPGKFRLVGEAYIDDPGFQKNQAGDLQWFKLW